MYEVTYNPRIKEPENRPYSRRESQDYFSKNFTRLKDDKEKLIKFLILLIMISFFSLNSCKKEIKPIVDYKNNDKNKLQIIWRDFTQNGSFGTIKIGLSSTFDTYSEDFEDFTLKINER